MDFIFIKQRSCLFAVTGFLLWINLSNGLPTTSLTERSFSQRVEDVWLTGPHLTSWLKALADQATAPLPQWTWLPTTQQGVYNEGLAAYSANYYLIYVSHCNQRSLDEDHNPFAKS